MKKSRKILALSLLAPVAAVAVLLTAALSYPLRAPPFLPSIQTGAKAMDQSHIAAVTPYKARDGVDLAYRFYPAQAAQAGADKTGTPESIAILVHGSSGSGRGMTAVAQALAAAGVSAVAVDIRGHGASGVHGDIAYLGQLEADLQDLLTLLRITHPDARFILVGHSSGGGFALRIAGGPVGRNFARFVLLAPYLGRDAPTSRKSEGTAHWAEADVPRIVALAMLNQVGVKALDGLPVLAFAVAPGMEAVLTPEYSWRLMRNFAVPMNGRGASDFRGSFAKTSRPIAILSGADDELIDAARYPETIAGSGAGVSVKILPGVDHMGIAREPAALAAVVTAVQE